ncbi:hypothetical protein ACFQ0R_00760 [Psychroflexus salinarum]|uniref:Uncharacterized protein n=1 Tax=Psychroflexus salinarum TaxID=546024 RepID=A0ABW3GKH4_9FLAO
MKNIYLYYISILAPLLFILWLSSSDTIDSTLFFIVLIVYAFIYRPFVDGKRLAEKNILQNKDIWKMLYPGNHLNYFKELYFT